MTFESLLYNKRKGDGQKEGRSAPRGNEVRGHEGVTGEGRED